MSHPSAPTVIAFYLPQFQPTPYNDAWWGPGFTEWTHVAAARPLFRGHVQPRLPGELGFYDLRLPETRAAQADLATSYGVDCFCYWHYWFGGTRLLNETFDDVVASSEPGITFCLGWANEPWTAVWAGRPDKILIPQTYPGAADDRAHFDCVEPAFHDQRYLRVDGRPVFYVYRPRRDIDPGGCAAVPSAGRMPGPRPNFPIPSMARGRRGIVLTNRTSELLAVQLTQAQTRLREQAADPALLFVKIMERVGRGQRPGTRSEHRPRRPRNVGEGPHGGNPIR